jgi:aryl-alcohol dehydrogenase-like predicted oxidoreductase
MSPAATTRICSIRKRVQHVCSHQTLGQLALRFVLSHPAVSIAIPGAKTPTQVEVNAAASVRPLLSEGECQMVDDVAPAPSVVS